MFSYGMNTNNDQMSPDCVRLGAAHLKGWAWEMLLYANVYVETESICTGILWDINEAALAELDIREGYPTFYNRVLVDVEHCGTIKQAWVYTMTAESKESLQHMEPSQHYFDSVIAGYATDGLTIPTATKLRHK